jgi:hypothetical protein
MFERTHDWTAKDGHRKRFFVRVWWHGWRAAWPQLKRWLWRKKRWEASYCAEFLLRNLRGQSTCYCPTGSITSLEVRLFGLGFWVELSRDWTPKPCSCDKVLWCMHPEDHADDIEDYGEERLRAEYPELWVR